MIHFIDIGDMLTLVGLSGVAKFNSQLVTYVEQDFIR